MSKNSKRGDNTGKETYQDILVSYHSDNEEEPTEETPNKSEEDMQQNNNYQDSF